MADPLSIFWQRRSQDWLMGDRINELLDQVKQAQAELEEHRTAPSQPLKILLAERDPIRFLARFLVASSVPSHLFLCNPDWGLSEWQQVFAQVQPDLFWSEVTQQVTDNDSATSSTLDTQLPPALILIPTGGSSGQVRFVMHTWDTLLASVKGFQQYFEVDAVNSLCVLPLYHVSGLMQFVRSLTSGGKLALSSIQQLEQGDDPPIQPADWFLSLVPTQLQRLLHGTEKPGEIGRSQWLAQFRAILLGGAPAWDSLLIQARQSGISLAPTYGMTETASQIATLKPADFLAGKAGCGQVLPHAQVTICDSQGLPFASKQVGSIQIQAKSLALGYFPHPWQEPTFSPDDLGIVDDQGYLQIVGRQSHKIITGGENVFPAEVEAAIRSTGHVQDVAVIGVPDLLWGEVVTAVYVPNGKLILADLKDEIATTLTNFKRPKHWLEIDQLPRNAQGKINRSQLTQWVQEQLSSTATID